MSGCGHAEKGTESPHWRKNPRRNLFGMKKKNPAIGSAHGNATAIDPYAKKKINKNEHSQKSNAATQ